MLKLLGAVVAIAGVGLSPASANMWPTVVDDRSGPQHLVLSYFNAVSLGDLDRAYGYFSAMQAPDRASWEPQVAGLIELTVAPGRPALIPTGVGAIYKTWVHVDLQQVDGQHRYEAGCVTMSALTPSAPLSIISVELHAVEAIEYRMAPGVCDNVFVPVPTEPYLDDRSTPEQLVRSYYNALARGEYRRAWSYYGPAADPAEYAGWLQSEKRQKTLRLAIGVAVPDTESEAMLVPELVENQQPEWTMFDTTCTSVMRGAPGDTLDGYPSLYISTRNGDFYTPGQSIALQCDF